MTRRTPVVALVWDLATVALAKASLGAAVLASGFVALSDDDFSRIVIAERFARAPSLDPSGTSWLPLPFWVHGAAMAAFGRTLATAHGTALALGILSALLVHHAALLLGASRVGAVLGALAATSIPTAARLGVASQPEALAAGLLMLGAASSGLPGSRRLIGAIALSAAALCRYEAWAAALAFAMITAIDAARGLAPRDADSGEEIMHSGFVRAGTAGREHSQSRALLGAAALVAIAGPVAWLAHGVASHGSALFFMSRVAAYRRALGASEPVLSSLVAYPLALLRTEPEVALVSVVALRMVADRAPGALRGLGRPALVLAGILAFLMVGRLLDGAPTHHAERTLLPIWTGLALLAAEALVRAARPSSDSSRGAELARGMPVLLAIAAASVALRITTPREPFAARRAERAIGYAARRLVPEGDRIAIDTADYGYFAVIATFGAPERAEPIDRHDPRDPPAEDPFVSAERLRSCLASHRAGWLVARQPHLSIASAIGEAVATAGELSLVSVAPSTR